MGAVSRPAGNQLEGIPILPSLDISETLCFYRDRLGFSPRVDAGENYLIVRRETIELHF